MMDPLTAAGLYLATSVILAAILTNFFRWRDGRKRRPAGKKQVRG